MFSSVIHLSVLAIYCPQAPTLLQRLGYRGATLLDDSILKCGLLVHREDNLGYKAGKGLLKDLQRGRERIYNDKFSYVNDLRKERSGS